MSGARIGTTVETLRAAWSARATPRDLYGGGPPGRDGGAIAPRVLLITGEYPPTVGGVGDYTAALATHLRAAGARPVVLTGRGAAITREDWVRRVVPGWGLAGWRTILRAIRAERPDIIHIQYQAGAFAGRGGITLLPWWLARRKRRPAPPVVATFHDLCVPYLFPKAGPLRRRALHLLARGGAATIATNGDDWAQLRAILGRDVHEGVPDLRLIPIGSNIPASACPRGEAGAATRAALGLAPGTTLVAYFGLVSASKGVDTLLDALRALVARGEGEFALLLIGGEASATDAASFGAERDLAGAIRSRGLVGRVIVTGVLPPEAVAAHLAAADLIALPYRDGATWRRGSLLAALAAGVPTITTYPPRGHDAGGLLPRLREGEGTSLVAPDNPEALAIDIRRLAGDAALRERLAAGARRLAAAFDWETIARAHLGLYAALLRRVPPVPGARR